MKLDHDQKKTYAGMYVLKLMDLDPKDGGKTFPVVLPPELAPLDEVLSDLAVADLISIDAKKGVYRLAPAGQTYLGELIDEAADMVDELDDLELEEALAELRARRLDVFRARFLWGWYEGELDDLVAWQERRGVRPVERMWAFYLLSDGFYAELARELEPAQ
jgi:hypothetical protein